MKSKRIVVAALFGLFLSMIGVACSHRAPDGFGCESADDCPDTPNTGCIMVCNLKTYSCEEQCSGF